MSRNLKEERIGAVRVNKYGSKMTVVEYNHAKNIVVKFNNGYTVRSAWNEFDKGAVKSPYCKSVYGVGFLGEGNYKPMDTNGVHSTQYTTWLSMLSRCYTNARLGYQGCTVSKDWHNFQNFAKWYEDNYYEIKGERMELDKDLLRKGNKEYSEKSCVFLPLSINSMLQKNRTTRGDLPIGVHFDKDKGKYRASCNRRGKSKFLGRYSTPEEAFAVYKEAKEKYIKEVALEYKDDIPLDVYLAMTLYEVDIND